MQRIKGSKVQRFKGAKVQGIDITEFMEQGVRFVELMEQRFMAIHL